MTNHDVGTSAEREVARILGGRRIGQYLGPVDVIIDGYLAVQVKRTKGQPSLARCAGLIEDIPAGLLRAVVAVSRPGRGHKAQRLIVMRLDEFAEWHGRRNEQQDLEDAQAHLADMAYDAAREDRYR
jgi:hypothetical protein